MEQATSIFLGIGVGLTLGFILGLLLELAFNKKTKKLFKKLFVRASLIKTYWLLTSFLLLISIGSCAAVLNYSSSENREVYIQIWSLYTTLLTAIFGGYYAFVQVIESRFQKFASDAHHAFRKQDYITAMRNYRQAFRINHKDTSCTLEFLEILAVQGRDIEFEEVKLVAEEACEETQHKLLLKFLSATQALLNENLGNAKRIISEITAHAEAEPNSIAKLAWDFGDIQKSERFKILEPATKQIFNNLFSYLKSTLKPEDKAKFESGNYSFIRTL